MKITSSSNHHDLEAGAAPLLYPAMTENPELRWGFIRKVYAILTAQILLTIPVAAAVVLVRPVAELLALTWLGNALCFMISLMSFVVLVALYSNAKKHPLNYILLGVFTICLALMVGVSCAFISGVLVLEAAMLTAAIFLSLTLYTFWGAMRGHDFNFLGPFLFSSLNGLINFGLIQIFFPLGRTGNMIYEVLGVIIFCGYIVYDTDNLIKRYQYDEYIMAAINLYLDIINLFLQLLKAMADEGADDEDADDEDDS